MSSFQGVSECSRHSAMQPTANLCRAPGSDRKRPLPRPCNPRPRPTGAPPSSPSPARSTTSCASTRNAPSQTTTRCATSAALQTPAPPPPLRQGQGPRPRIPRRHNGRLPWTAMSGAIPRRWPTDRQPNPRGRVTRFDATDRRPVDKWTAAPRPTTSPQGQKPQQKRSTHMVHKPVNSECSRHSAMQPTANLCRAGSDRKRRPAPARRGCIGVFDHEPRADQLVRIINHRIGQKRQ